MAIERYRSPQRSQALDRHQWFILSLGLAVLLLLAPAFARAQGADSLTLSWTAPGDDGLSGTATQYELRMSTTPITAANFAGGTLLTSLPAPLPAGTRQSFIARNLSRQSEYWFAIRTRDDVGNWSDISNIVRWTWPADNAPPAAPTGLAAAEAGTGNAVRLSWNANSEANLAGYIVYRAIAASGPWQRLNVQALTATQYVDSDLPLEQDKLYYQVSATNASGREGARSASVNILVQSIFARDPVAWRLRPAYPNPARVGEVVHLPLEAPASSGAHVDIVDAAGQRVRRLDVIDASVGVVELHWDGRNDAGRECAPGVYRAWMMAPGVTQFVRIARVP